MPQRNFLFPAQPKAPEQLLARGSAPLRSPLILPTCWSKGFQPPLPKLLLRACSAEVVAGAFVQCCLSWVSQRLGAPWLARVRRGQRRAPGAFTDTIGERVGATETAAGTSAAPPRLQYVCLSLSFAAVNFIPALRNHHSFPLFYFKMVAYFSFTKRLKAFPHRRRDYLTRGFWDCRCILRQNPKFIGKKKSFPDPSC